MNPKPNHPTMALLLLLCGLATGISAQGESIRDIHLVLNSLTNEGNWWGVTDIHVWDEKGKIVRPLKIDANRRSGTSNNFGSTHSPFHVGRINDTRPHTGWAPRVGGLRYDQNSGCRNLEHPPTPLGAGWSACREHLAVSAKDQARQNHRRHRYRQNLFQVWGPTTFHEFESIRNPGGVGSPDDRYVHATYFGKASKRR